MTVFKHIRFVSPYLRINNRQYNIDFYTQLGFKVLWEENSLVFLGTASSKEPVLVLDESPSMRTRAVKEAKKLHTLCLTISFEEIEYLLAQKFPVDKVFKGEQGYGFYVTSPEGDRIQVYGDGNQVFVEEVDRPEVSANPAVQGVTDVTVRSIVLHVPDVGKSTDFYMDMPVSILPVQGEGEDLMATNDETWDLSSLSFAVEEDRDLQEVAAYFAGLGAKAQLLRKGRSLVVTDPSNIELWFEK